MWEIKVLQWCNYEVDYIIDRPCSKLFLTIYGKLSIIMASWNDNFWFSFYGTRWRKVFLDSWTGSTLTVKAWFNINKVNNYCEPLLFWIGSVNTTFKYFENVQNMIFFFRGLQILINFHLINLLLFYDL